jgi:hypothetical protein
VLIKEPVPDVGVENHNASDVHQGHSTSLAVASHVEDSNQTSITKGSSASSEYILGMRALCKFIVAPETP